jgi:hypothetical protein
MSLGAPPTPQFPIDPDDVRTHYDRAGFADLSDANLFDLAARAVARPKRDAASSFVLHAPLELAARRLLLPLVAPRHRRAVRQRILTVATAYERAGEPADPPPVPQFDSFDRARAALLEAIALGDLEHVDAAASWIVEEATFDQIMTLTGPTLDMVGAAGHASIAFFLTSRLADTSRWSLRLLRPTLRELAREGELRVHWTERSAPPTGDEQQFASALANTPRLGIPGSDFVYPIVHQVDRTGVASEVIESTVPPDISRAETAMLRVAARSMLQDDPAFAPYGWTHCLTLPQAILQLRPWLPDSHRAAGIAATYVVGFRAAVGQHAIDLDWAPEPTSVEPLPSLDQGPEVAARAWYHADDHAVAQALPELVGRAAMHEDAHLAKYTYACLVAAETDSGQRSLYRAAAASLAAWWAAR